MKTEVEVTVRVRLDLKVPKGEESTIAEIKKIASDAAAELVRTGLFYANREIKGYDAPRLVDDREGMKTWPIHVEGVIIK